MQGGHTGHNLGSYESFTQYAEVMVSFAFLTKNSWIDTCVVPSCVTPSDMRPFLFGYHISF